MSKLQSTNVKTTAARWRVQKRIFYISELTIELAKSNIDLSLKQLWDSGASVVIVQLLENEKLSSANVSKSADVDGYISLKLELGREEINFPESLKAQLREIIQVYKPTILVSDLDGDRAVVVLELASEFGMPIASSLAEDSPAYSYSENTGRKLNSSQFFPRKSEKNSEAIFNALNKLINPNKEWNNDEFDLKTLRVAAVMDEFTYHSFSPECNLKQLNPAKVIEELEAFRPELLFIESAWRGLNGLWDKKIGNPSAELKQAIVWCKERLIPTVFWNKEDPVHFQTFLNTASLFDIVFTTDIDCIASYKGALGHDRVYLLPFACQPRMHNPIELYDRKDAFCFAGAYYERYPERTRDLEGYIAELPKFRPFEIYDRNYGKNDERYQFPSAYKPFIVGSLPFNEIDKAYKGYKYAINLNSIKQSQTMFARRVYELCASNTFVISNFSIGIKLIFGDLFICSDDGRQILHKLRQFSGSNAIDKLKLMALRKVMLDHTYENRLKLILRKIFPHKAIKSEPKILVVGVVNNAVELNNLVLNYNRQVYSSKKMIIFLQNDVETSETQEYEVHKWEEIKGRKISDIFFGYDWISYMSVKNFYGDNYLIDLMLAANYTNSGVIGKHEFYSYENQGLKLNNANHSYKYVKNLKAECSIIKREKVNLLSADIFFNSLKNNSIGRDEGLSVDKFNYCENFYPAGDIDNLAKIIDSQIDEGLRFGDLLSSADAIKAIDKQDDLFDIDHKIQSEYLYSIFKDAKNSDVYVEYDQQLNIYSKLNHEKHTYLYSKKIPINILFIENQQIFYLSASHGLNIQLAFLFIGNSGQRLSQEIIVSNKNSVIICPDDAKDVILGLRIYGPGEASINSLYLHQHNEESASIILECDYLIITNIYPSYDNIYRNGFVHSQARAFKGAGYKVNIFVVSENSQINFREYEDLIVISGSLNSLSNTLNIQKYKAVLVHFISQSIFIALEPFLMRHKFFIWIHGAEIQLWNRRAFAYDSEDELLRQKLLSQERELFWRNLFLLRHCNIKFIFVSNYLYKSATDDLGVYLEPSQFKILPNPISTEIFRYREKSPISRKKILLIRPFASKIYANDLAVNAILWMAKKNYFSELDVLIAGDGALFDEITLPLLGYKNIKIKKGFLRQHEIAKLHEEYGIFLCPSRMDTQGVSRDEAMSSGLVPVTNAVAAIPEFLREDCGVLASPDDYLGLAKGIEYLIDNPKVFLKKSKNAAENIRSSRSDEIIFSELISYINSNCLDLANE